MVDKQFPEINFRREVHSSLDAFDPVEWDQLAGNDNPFCLYAFFKALEQSQAITSHTGWSPQYVSVYQNDKLIAVAPCFIKSHPMGEYVFDWSWADAYEAHGLDYYPKLVCAIPFTPVTGPRYFIHPSADYHIVSALLLEQVEALARQYESSGFHILFPEKSEIQLPCHAELAVRQSVQFHWYNRGYSHFDDFLASLTSRKRKSIRKERKSALENDVTICVKEGENISEDDWRQFYCFYRNTYLKRSGHEGYLNETFFMHLGVTMPNNLVLICGMRNEKIVAASLFLRSSSTLFGRYWGCSEEHNHLHFELCYYQGIEYCIENQLTVFEAGAQGEHKLIRGFEPIWTYSLHKLFHPQFHSAIEDFVDREKQHLDLYKKDAEKCLPYKHTAES
ncbi:GNAT family N-acetyltransferase [Veronia nyctiphanis]|uniref:GNAT family N-acetyltransferase n=1 Tax=Veronia nyctiphanis TaxID=1278244 RepID=A0A4Q0YRM5_9GAMM|nr:GNAT family N-acetyltransferase [Veronia nyctiphanis]RXJ73273.1 GNAT family N-acetyltransferase [Veronia nyctiphanis]